MLGVQSTRVFFDTRLIDNLDYTIIMTVKDIKDPEKPGSVQMEVVSAADSVNAAAEGDYSGAVSKSSAAEISLCRKLDRRILPVLWAMYYL